MIMEVIVRGIMKKYVYILIIVFSFPFFVGCSNNKNLDSDFEDDKQVETEEKIEEEEKYIDTNPIKIALYSGKNGKYKRQDDFYSKLEPIKDIGLFSIILSNDLEVSGNGIKGLYSEYKNQYENFSNYKVGYNIRFSLKDGTEFNETILKPLLFSEFSFHDYLYVWLYDDIHNSGWYSHLEPDDYNENTVMSSIKLMSTSGSREIVSPIYLTVFTYDEDDFDESGNYRGISQFTTLIKRESEK